MNWLTDTSLKDSRASSCTRRYGRRFLCFNMATMAGNGVKTSSRFIIVKPHSCRRSTTTACDCCDSLEQNLCNGESFEALFIWEEVSTPPGLARTPEIPDRRASHSKVRKCLHDKWAGNGKSARLTGPASPPPRDPGLTTGNASARLTELKVYCVCVSACVCELVS